MSQKEHLLSRLVEQSKKLLIAQGRFYPIAFIVQKPNDKIRPLSFYSGNDTPSQNAYLNDLIEVIIEDLENKKISMGAVAIDTVFSSETLNINAIEYRIINDLGQTCNTYLRYSVGPRNEINFEKELTLEPWKK